MILVTGGAGYVGSHACVELAKAGHDVVVFDNFCNSSPRSIAQVERICGRSIPLVEGDVRDQRALEAVLARHGCTAVMHFAGLKSVEDSISRSDLYYETNVVGTQRLLGAMRNVGVKKLIFSSSATVYGAPKRLPCAEDHPLDPTHPYGSSKLSAERMLGDVFATEQGWRFGILRYFNPAGAHDSGLIGEDPRGRPGNLLPLLARVALGRETSLPVWGGDYATDDGTGVRDYVHVMDVAAGHVAALALLDRKEFFTVNLGTGAGTSVFQIVRAFEAVSGKTIAYELRPRRAGDVAVSYAATGLARELMDWQARRGIDLICADQWRWQSSNPEGYG